MVCSLRRRCGRSLVAVCWGRPCLPASATRRADEGPRLLRSIGNRNAVILRNHGLLAWGQTLPQTFAILWTLQRACEIQMATFSMGAAIPVSEDIAQRCTRDALQFSPEHGAGQDVFDALVRQVDRIDPSYRN